jgi:hypothetical protein
MGKFEAFRKDTVFFPTSSILNGMREMVGFPYAHKSRAFELKHGAAVAFSRQHAKSAARR